MIKSPIPFVLLITQILTSACGTTKEQDNLNADEATVTVGTVSKSAIERHARVGMNTTRIAEERRIALTKVSEVSPFYKDADGKMIYYKSETVPTYVGGDTAIALFLEENLVYPHSKQAENREGTIFVDFIINANGSIRNVKTTDSTFVGADKPFREEAIRLVNLMPKWTPGRQHGEPIDVEYSVAITFLIE